MTHRPHHRLYLLLYKSRAEESELNSSPADVPAGDGDDTYIYFMNNAFELKSTEDDEFEVRQILTSSSPTFSTHLSIW